MIVLHVEWKFLNFTFENVCHVIILVTPTRYAEINMSGIIPHMAHNKAVFL
jgi:hypothetical protein